MDTDVQHVLLPCAICARTFQPQSLEKHKKVCERAAIKKRKPFDSAKQRIQGTELAEFLPKQEKKRHASDDRTSKPKPSSAWKQKHDDFLRTIRAVRNEIADSTMQKQCGTVTSSAPTRSNEQGMCPTCNRHFGVKAYDRHVAWCKERITRMPVSPATNIAKERLEARMRYRAPALKGRRQTTREKYSPSSAITLNSTSKASPTRAVVRAKESASAPTYTNSNSSPVKQKPHSRRAGQTRDSPASNIPMKSRPIDRTNRPSEDKPGPLSFRPAPPVVKRSISYLPVPPLKHPRESLEECVGVSTPTSCKTRARQTRERGKKEEVASHRGKPDEKHQTQSARSQKTNIVSARSQGNPRLNDVSINDDIVGFTVKPCNIYKDNSFTTWKQISQKKRSECDDRQKHVKAQQPVKPIDLSHLNDQRVNVCSSNERLVPNDVSEVASAEDTYKDDTTTRLSTDSESMNWSTADANLNQTYSFRDSARNEELDDAELSRKTWNPVKHSPRVEFFLGDLEKANRERASTSYDFPHPSEVSLRKASRESLRKEKVEDTGSKDTVVIKNEEPDETEELDIETRNTQLAVERFQSMRSKILQKKRLAPTTSAELLTPDDYDNFEKVESWCNEVRSTKSQDDLKNSDASDIELNDVSIRDADSINCGNTETARTRENVNVNDNGNENAIDHETDDAIEESWKEYLKRDFDQKLDLQLTDCKPDDYPDMFDFKTNDTIDNDEPLEEADRSLLQDDGSIKETIDTTDFDNPKEENEDPRSDVKDSHHLLPNETEYFTDDDVTSPRCIETTFPEGEACPFTKDELRPTGSSTPFVTTDKEDIFENSKEELYQAPTNPPDDCEWKVARNVDTGSEILYRVESRESNYSRRSSRRNVDQSNRDDSADKTLQLQSRASSCEIILEPKRSSSRRSLITDRKETESYSRLQSPATLTDAIVKREIASQINMCHCPLDVHSARRCESKAVECNDLVKRTSEMELQCRDISSSKREHRRTVKEPLVRPTTTTLYEGDRSANEPKSSKSRTTEMVDEGSDHREGKHVHESANKRLEKESNEEIHEIYKSCATENFDYDSDNGVEQDMRQAINNLKPSSCKRDRIDVQKIIMSESRVKLRRSTTLKSRRSKVLEIRDNVREDGHALNDSSDSLTSPMNGLELGEVRHMESVEVETIEEIGTRNKTSRRFQILPEIKGSRVVVKEDHDQGERSYWEKASRTSKNRLSNYDPPYQGASRFLKRNPKVRVLSPVPSGSSLIEPSGKDYDPFMLAEQQMKDLLSDTSEQSVTDSASVEQNREISFPLSHSSAFVKYPCQSSLSNPEKRSSLIAPPSEFDDLASDFSSDSTETNSLSRETFLKDPRDGNELKESISRSSGDKESPVKELGRRVIIDKSKALGAEVAEDGDRGSKSFVASSERARKILDKVSSKVVRPTVNRSSSVRASSAPKTVPDSHESRRFFRNGKELPRGTNHSLNNRNNNNNYANLSSSNLSLSSIVSSDMDIKRSNSLFDELMSSFEDETGSLSSLKSLLKDNSLSVSSPIHGRQRNGQISDEELSSPDSYKRQDHSKLSADSAYSSLNRKYSHHGRSTSDMTGRHEEEPPRSNRRDGDGVTNATKCKMSKYCHQCGSKFPETAKFCCECGIRRLVL